MRIEHRICENNLGDTDNEYSAAYVAALKSRLSEEYPDAEIVVNLKSDFANTCQTFVAGAPCTGPDDDDSAIRENVDLIANLVWERM